MQRQHMIVLGFAMFILVGLNFSGAQSAYANQRYTEDPEKYDITKWPPYSGWFKCEQGQLQVKDKKVRCYQGSYYSYNPVLPCARGQVYRQDHVGKEDRCVNQFARGFRQPGTPACLPEDARSSGSPTGQGPLQILGPTEIYPPLWWIRRSQGRRL